MNGVWFTVLVVVLAIFGIVPEYAYQIVRKVFGLDPWDVVLLKSPPMKLRISIPPADPALGVFGYRFNVTRGTQVVLNQEVPEPFVEIDNPPAGSYGATVETRNIAGYSPVSTVAAGPSIPPKPPTPVFEVIP